MTILHVDLDAFYASVEQRDDPSLRGRPVLVGGRSRRSVVCAASYEARPFGVRSAMPMGEALRRCPDAVVVIPRMSHYAEISAAFFGILHRWSPLVEGLSLDEAFLDVSGEERLFGAGEQIGARIKTEVKDELSLVVSVGVAPTKFVAKIASDVGKPDGLLVIEAGAVQSFLRPLPVGRLWGVGKVTEESLARLGLKTIGDVERAGVEAIRPSLGIDSATHLYTLACGIDDREVVNDRAAVSIGHQDTFGEDVRDRADLTVHLLDQIDRVCARLRGAGLRAGSVTLRIKYGDHRAVTRQSRLSTATTDARAFAEVVERLLAEVPDIERRGVRLTGVSAGALESALTPRQLGLGVDGVPDVERGERLGAVLDKISGKFGTHAVRRAVSVGAEVSPLRSSGSMNEEARRPGTKGHK